MLKVIIQLEYVSACSSAFGICWDPAKMKAEVTWDAKANCARHNRFEPSGECLTQTAH